MPGVGTVLNLVPAEDLAVVVLANGGRGTMLVSDLLMKTLLPRWTVPAKQMSRVPTITPIPQLTGIWEGRLHIPSADRTLRLECLPSGHLLLRVDRQPVGMLTDVTFENDWLEGLTTADVGTPEVNRHPHYDLAVDLKLRGGVLEGGMTAQGGSPRPFAITYWAQLQKQQ